MSPVVRVVDGRFGYRGRVVVEADLEVAEGEVLALVGANGSGKTTLLKGILGLAERLGGSVELFGEDAGALRDRWRLGYVPQRQSVAGPIPATVREVVGAGRLARRGLLGRLRRDDRHAVAEAIDAVGLGDLADRRIGELSGGQQRRALVARALAGQAELLFLDEPLAGVDRDSRAALASILGDLVAGGSTIVVVLHELGPLAPLITRVVRMEGGTLATSSTGGAPHEPGHESDPHPQQPPRPGLGLVR